MSDRTVISARIPQDVLKDLKVMAESSGQSLTDVIVEGLAAHVGRELPTTWGDRLGMVEGEVRELRKKLSGWG